MSALPARKHGQTGQSAADMAGIIETGRLVLRPHRLSDAGAIARGCGDPLVNRMLARVPVPYYRQDALEWLLKLTANHRRDRIYAITPDGETHIGVVSLELRHGRWHFGYWLDRSHWGQGLMTEAADAVLARFFAAAEHETVFSGVFADNPASLKIQQKLGFIVTGCSDIYSLSRGAMVPHIETMLRAGDLLPRPRP